MIGVKHLLEVLLIRNPRLKKHETESTLKELVQFLRELPKEDKKFVLSCLAKAKRK